MFKSISRQGRIRTHISRSSFPIKRIPALLGPNRRHVQYDSIGQYGRWAVALSLACHALVLCLPVPHGHLNGFGKLGMVGAKVLSVLSLQPSVRLHLLVEPPSYHPAVSADMNRPDTISPSLPEPTGYTVPPDHSIEDKEASLVPITASAPISDREPDLATIKQNADGSVQWGADIYYSAPQLDQLAQAASTVMLPEVAQTAPVVQTSDNIAPSPPVIRLLVFINETGSVDGVQLVESSTPEVAAAIMNTFRQVLFMPARKQGRPVKSVKQISIFPPG